jgi:hypothetical protein
VLKRSFDEHEALGPYAGEEVMMMVAICTHLDQIRVNAPEEVAGCKHCLKGRRTLGAPAGLSKLRAGWLL